MEKNFFNYLEDVQSNKTIYNENTQYYKKQFEKLTGDMRIKISGETGDSKWLDLNIESAKIVCDFLKNKFGV